MGSSVVGSTRISYYTKDKIPIEYIYYDLKGKNRFPNPPNNDKESTHPSIQSKTCSIKPSALSMPPKISSKF